jgi:hypothetical protein
LEAVKAAIEQVKRFSEAIKRSERLISDRRPSTKYKAALTTAQLQAKQLHEMLRHPQPEPIKKRKHSRNKVQKQNFKPVSTPRVYRSQGR